MTTATAARCAALFFETGSVRLQEANLGLAAIAEIHAAIVDIAAASTVMGIMAGLIGCYGGMSLPRRSVS